MERDLEQVHNVLKESDAVVYQSVRALGFKPVLYVYDDDSSHNSPPTGVIVDQWSGFYDMYCMISKSRFPKFYKTSRVGFSCVKMVRRFVKIVIVMIVGTSRRWSGSTPMTVYNRQKEAFVSYDGNEPSLNWAYGDVCMIVRRLAYESRIQQSHR
jgi:hypothetical protein